MVYRSISADIKRRALVLLGKGWEIDGVIGVLDVSAKSITRWESKYEMFGCVESPSVLRGRPRIDILNSTMTEDLRRLVLEEPSIYLEEVREWLAIYHDQPLSITALHVNLVDLPIKSNERLLPNEMTLPVPNGCTTSQQTTQVTRWSFSTNQARMTAPSSANIVVQ